ncbi:hypothetical protein, partial [Acinetobacter baumannii]|uniref:hypothetical protein n=1 Tax=Acinetobacter baumannii TaxID=470 RepID=UPI003394253A
CQFFLHTKACATVRTGFQYQRYTPYVSNHKVSWRDYIQELILIPPCFVRLHSHTQAFLLLYQIT